MVASYQWHWVDYDFVMDTASDAGSFQLESFPLQPGESLQRFILRFGIVGEGTTLGAVFGLVPSPWLIRARVYVTSFDGDTQYYWQTHPAELHSQPQFDDTSPDTPWHFQFSVMPFDVDIRARKKIPDDFANAKITFSIGVVDTVPGVPNGFQYAMNWRADGSFQWLTSRPGP